MPTVVCHHCSETFTVDGPKPDQCPSCGRTLHIEGDPTPTGPALHSTIIHIPERNPVAFGRYIVQSRLGAGGFGTVFLAQDPQLKRPVAIKVPRGETGRSPLGLERFAREARNIAQLRHENIVSVFDVELDGEPPFIVCDYVNGETLSDRTKREPLSFREAAQLIADVAKAVAYAHKNGIIHRDIKPSNIMIDSDGNPRLMDFGLAKRETIDNTVTTGHAILGTPAYMSPEQAWGGKRGAVDRRSDIYSLGTVLYQLLTRELPFRGEPRMVLRQVIEDDPKSPRTLNADIPRDLETICDKAMQKEPASRYQTAGALADDLNRWLRGEPIEARPATRLERSWRWCRRNPAPAGLVVGAIAFLVALSGGLWGYAAVQTSARRNADNARKEIEEVLAKNQELLSHAYVEKGSRYVRAPQASDDYNPQKALPWLIEALKLDAKNPDRLLADRIRLQTQMDIAPRLERMWFFQGDVRASAVSPKRDTFFIAGADGTVNIWRTANDGPPIASLAHPAAVNGAAYSPDGKRLATCCQDGLRIWDIASGQPLMGPLVVRVPHVEMRAASSPPGTLIIFDNSGDYLFAEMRQGLNQIWNSRTGEPIGPPIVGQARNARFADSGRLVVFHGGDWAIHVHDARTGAEKYVLRGEKRSLSGRAEIYPRALVSPEGATVAGLRASGDLVLYASATGKKTAELVVPQSPGSINCVSFSSDGLLIATGSSNGMVRLWKLTDVRSLWGRNIASGLISWLQFSPDGSTLAVRGSDKRICMVAPESGAGIAPPICNDSPLRSANWVDSGRILTVDVDGVARLWKLDNNLPVLRLPHAHQIALATISADRRVLATTEGNAGVCVLQLPANGRPEAEGLKLVQVGDAAVTAIALNADGSQFAIADKQQVSIWNSRDAKKRIGPFVHGEAVKLVRFTPDGTLLVCVSIDGRATVWDVAAGRRLYEPLDVSQGPLDLDIDHDGRRCAVAAVRGVTIWDLKTGIRVRPGFFAEGASQFVRFVGDPKFMLVSSLPTGRIKVWDITSGQPIRTVSSGRDLQPLALSDDKTLCLAGYQDGTARLLSSMDGAPRSPAFDCPSGVVAATIDQTGRWVATVSRDLNVSLWNAQSAELLATLRPHDLEPMLSQRARLSLLTPLVFFSADNHYLHVVAAQGLVTSIELDLIQQRQDQIADEIALSSGAQFDGAGGLRILEPSELKARWQSLNRRPTPKAVKTSTRQAPTVPKSLGAASP